MVGPGALKPKVGDGIKSRRPFSAPVLHSFILLFFFFVLCLLLHLYWCVYNNNNNNNNSYLRNEAIIRKTPNSFWSQQDTKSVSMSSLSLSCVSRR